MIICHGFSFSCFQVWIHDQPILTGYNSECLLMIFLLLFYPLTGLCSGLRSLKGDQSWVFIGRTDAKDETPILWPHDVKSKRPWCLGRLRAGEEDDRGWDGWRASPTRWTWVWANSRRQWRTRKPDVLQSMGSQRVGHDWTTELNWTELKMTILPKTIYTFSAIPSEIPLAYFRDLEQGILKF